MSSENSSLNIKRIIFWFLIVLISLVVRLLYISDPIIEIHGFRQTQTAISVFYMLKEGLSLENIINYLTPVLGEPWKVPMEFPIYQVSVCIIHNLINLFISTSLDISLRLTSILYFYLALPILFQIIKKMVPIGICYCFVFLYLLSPFSIIWSRSAMIETCSVFYSSIYLYSLIQFFDTNKNKYVLFSFIFGTIAFLCKSTTVLPFIFFAFLYFLSKQGKNCFNYKCLINKKLYYREILCFLLPILIGYIWVIYSDSIKDVSLAHFLTSKSLANWNFGTLDQRLNIDNAITIFERIFDQFPSLVFIVSLFIYLFILINKKCKGVSFTCFIYCVVTCLITVYTFFNLYYVHDYYLYAIFVFECLLFSITLYSVYIFFTKNQIIKKICFLSVVVLTLILSLNQYNRYLDVYVNRNFYGYLIKSFPLRISKSIKENCSVDKAVIIFDQDWSSIIPYYSERKSLMVTSKIYNDDFDKLISTFDISKDKYKLLLVSEDSLNDNIYKDFFDFLKKENSLKLIHVEPNEWQNRNYYLFSISRKL